MTKTELIKGIAQVLFDAANSNDEKSWKTLPQDIKTVYILDANKIYQGLADLGLGISGEIIEPNNPYLDKPDDVSDFEQSRLKWGWQIGVSGVKELNQRFAALKDLED